LAADQPAGVLDADPVLLGAVRVLGADVFAAQAFLGVPPAPRDLELVRTAVALAPAPHAPLSVTWMHWGLCAALRDADPRTRTGVPPVAQPDAQWAAVLPWPALTHRMAQIAALATPAMGQNGRMIDCALTRQVSGRVTGLARGFARAVRRRDWPQAAGVARWLSLLGGTPCSLGLAAGLDYVERLGGTDDARVRLHIQAARMLGAASRR
jgi:hypothetical protein